MEEEAKKKEDLLKKAHEKELKEMIDKTNKLETQLKQQ